MTTLRPCALAGTSGVTGDLLRENTRSAKAIPSLVKASPDRAGKVAARKLAGKIAGGELGLDLHPRVRRNHVVGERHPLVDGDALADERVAFHVAHRREAVDAGDPE